MGVGPRRIANAYLEVDRWVRSAVGNELIEATQLDEEMDAITAEIAVLEQRRERLRASHAEVSARVAVAETQRGAMLYETLFDVLAEQSRAVELRAAEAREAEVRGDSALLARLVEDPQRAAKLQEFLDFEKSVAPGLAAFPEDYRKTVTDAHRAVKKELIAWFESIELPVTPARGKELAVDVLVAVDEPEDDVAVVMAVLPVSSDVQLKWHDRHDGLGTALAARAVEGMYRAAIGLGHPNAQVVMGGHRGLLVAEIVLDGDPGEFGPALAGAMQASLDRGVELQAARVRPLVKVVDVDHVLPHELFGVDDEEGADAG